MANFTLISPTGARLPLLNSNFFKLINISGQTYAQNALSSSTLSGADGDLINNAVTNPRTLTLDLYIDGNIELAKRHILTYVKPKQEHSIEWLQEKRTMKISGVCETIDMARWQQGIVMQISFHCSQPYWEDVAPIVREVSEIIRSHYFTDEPDDMLYFYGDGIIMGEYNFTRTQTFYNTGDVAVGLKIVVNALKTVTNPIIYASANEFIGANVTLDAGEILTITTSRGEKDIKKGDVSVLNKLMSGSTWLQLDTGANTFTINSDDEDTDNMYFEIIYNQRYV